MTKNNSKKPLGRRAYGSIPHLPGSRLGPGEHTITEGQARILTEKPRKGDTVYVHLKLDGSNVAIAKINGQIVPLTRSGYVANTSKYKQHHMFYDWVISRENYFGSILQEGERICGEWLAQAHGIRYLTHIPFWGFDLMRGSTRATMKEVGQRDLRMQDGFHWTPIVNVGPNPKPGSKLEYGSEAEMWVGENGTEMIVNSAIASIEQQNGDVICSFIAAAHAEYLGEFLPVV